MNAEAQNRIEQHLASTLRNDIDTALRAPGLEDVTILEVEIVARRLTVGPEAMYQFDVKPKFFWTWKRK
jgi:hypothetical protein